MGNNYTNYYYISTAGSLLSDMVIKFLLRSNTSSSTYTKILNKILLIESFYFYSRLLLPEDTYSLIDNPILDIKFKVLLNKLTFYSFNDNFYPYFNFLIRYSFEILLMSLNIILCCEMILALQNPISEVRNRMKIYNTLAILLFIIMFFVACFCKTVTDDNSKIELKPFFFVSDIVVLSLYFIVSFISCFIIIKQYWNKRNILTTIFILRHVLYVVVYTASFFVLKISVLYLNSTQHEYIKYFLLLNLSTGILLFPIRFLETRLLIKCISKKQDSTNKAKGKEEVQSNELSTILKKSLNLELMTCILYGLSEIYKQSVISDIYGINSEESKSKEKEEIKGRSTVYLPTGDLFNPNIKTLMKKYNVSKKDFKRIKIHKIQYNKPNSEDFDISDIKIQIVSDGNKISSMNRLSRIGLTFRPEQIDDVSFSERSSDLSIISEEKSFISEVDQKNHDAELIEYFPSIFKIIRTNDDISNQMLSNSLSPYNNKNFIKSLVESKGKSGSFFFFSEDHRFIIKTISNSELENILCRLMPNYFEYLVNNPETLIAKVYGIYTIAINEGSSKVHIILMQNLVTCKQNHLKYIFDLKGSTFQRFTKQIGKDRNPNRALKDLDFLWMKRVEKDLIQFSKDARDNILNQLESDVKMLSENNLMDYSLLFVIFKFPASEDKDYMDMVGLLGNQLYLNRTFKSNNMKYLYIIGIIDYLQNFNIRKFFEQKIKNIIYWKEGKNVSVQDPVTYKNRFLKFMKENMLEKIN